MRAIWHDIECGAYTEDLPVWRDLAARMGGPVLDVGAGTGRTTLDLARAGYAVTAIDLDDGLLQQLRERAAGLEVTTIVADARAFWVGEEFALCIVPMQTIQLLGGPTERAQFLECARSNLEAGGVLAIAIADELELFEVADGAPEPLPDVREIDGVVYSSRPIAVRADGDGFVLERRRETVTTDGQLTVERDLIRLDRLDAATLEEEGRTCGLRPIGRVPIPPTEDYVGSTVVVFRA
ncbi:MAG TPA: class I SAM-dependent methyltransferase [Solirubrobacteraceae bacterium]|jgi:SAM-dependent methyltransferase|nr:class I SAM-dependent methyltransferase [Solirubrobacteraceae bacterium]